MTEHFVVFASNRWEALLLLPHPTFHVYQFIESKDVAVACESCLLLVFMVKLRVIAMLKTEKRSATNSECTELYE